MSEPQSTTEAPVREGDILAGKYRVEKVLGVGGMGVVVAAMHTELDQRVALKFLLPSAAQNPSVVARFAREARAAAKIKSQHVARVIDVGTLENGTPYIVMEYLEGKDLSDILARDGRVPIGVAVDYVLQASEAIAEAHAAGFVHRDLKPPNLFLAHQSDGTFIIKVLDFGISKAVLADETSQSGSGSGHRGALTGTTEVFGSPMYMSPEQLKSARDVDARADLWALGVILYELMCGHAPFDRPTVAETFGAILYEQPVSLRKLRPEVPEELDRVILRCLEKDKAARLGNVAELAKALFPFAASASRVSLDRTSRVLRLAGLMADSVPPGPLLETEPRKAAAMTSASAQSGGQTRTAWDTASQVNGPSPRPRSLSRNTLIAGVLAGALVSGSVGVVVIRRLQRASPPVVVSVQADHPAEHPGALADDRATGAPTSVVAPPAVTPSVVTPSALTPSVTASATVAPGDAPSATAPRALGPRGKGRGGRLGPRGAPVAATPATAAPLPPTAKPAKPADGDDFGDRK